MATKTKVDSECKSTVQHDDNYECNQNDGFKLITITDNSNNTISSWQFLQQRANKILCGRCLDCTLNYMLFRGGTMTKQEVQHLMINHCGGINSKQFPV